MKNSTRYIFSFFFLFLPNCFLLGQWVQQPFPTSESLWEVQFINDTTGWVLGDSALYKTTNGGETWHDKDSTEGYGMFLNALNDKVVFYGDLPWSNNPSRGMRRTINGGESWTTIDTTLYYYTDLEFVNDQIGFVTGQDKNEVPSMLKTSDGGITWKSILYNFSPSNHSLEGISFADELHGWAVSYDAYVFNTTDGGNMWSLQDSIRPGVAPQPWVPVRDIVFTTPDSGWIVGGLSSFAITARTIDGGKNWTIFEWRGCSTREVTFLNSQIGWFVGFGNAPFIFNTKNGGINWEPQTLNYSDPQDRGFESISMIDKNLGWAVGWRPGKIYKYSNPEVTTAENKTESNTQKISGYSLEQNYPNPFNPSTTINFQIPKTDLVTIRIFDLLGKEITTLHNKITPAGKHKINFDSSGLASGIYYYQMQAGNFKEYKKFLLLE